MTKRNSNKPTRTARILTSTELAATTGGQGGITAPDNWEVSKLYTGVNDGGLLGVKSLTTGIGGLIG